MLTAQRPEASAVASAERMLDPALDEASLEAAERYGTPVYLLDVAVLEAAAALVEHAFPRPWIWQYSLKANDLPDVARLLARQGWGGNVVSRGEWRAATTAGIANHHVSLEGIGKGDADLEAAVQEAADGSPLRWLALESADEAGRLAELAGQYGLGSGSRPPLDVLARLNPAVDPETRPQFAVGAAGSKFGMDRAEIADVARLVAGSTGLRLRGVHVHTGSDLADTASWSLGAASAVRLVHELAREIPTVDTVDVGGGFPTPRPGAPLPADFAAALRSRLAEDGLTLPARCAVEPGRFLVGHAGWLVGSVLHVRDRAPHAQQVVLDCGMTELMRPALYGSRHEIHALGDEDPGADRLVTAVEGPVCELTDSFGIHDLPRLRRGDLVAIEHAGAYAASFTSRYNGRPQPREVLRLPDGQLRLAVRH